MKSVIRTGLALGVLLLLGPAWAQNFPRLIREAARQNGFLPAVSTNVYVDDALLEPGRILFESKSLSLNGDIACRSCHLEEFGSADGLPNAVAVGGQGKGAERIMGGGDVLPRNTLPFWGRGSEGFDVFFWDGKVDFSSSRTQSQFGAATPSADPLITAVHLPVVEIREMLAEDDLVLANKTESVDGANNLYAAIVERLQEEETEAVAALARHYGVDKNEIGYDEVAASLAAFIRHNFRVRPTRFHRFVFNDGELSAEELRGAQLFYGKGKCSACHAGPYLSDLDFHAIPFPQLGFGKNGFGVDYGRFNVTQRPEDLYKFRTPPLLNVAQTAPYGHSGSIASLRSAIIVHFDPLREIDPSAMSALDRHEYYKRLASSAESTVLAGYLDDEEVDALVTFLQTLSYPVGR